MNAPTRLLDSTHNPAARALLETARSDRSPPGSARRTARALGLSASALASVSAAAGAASAAASATGAAATTLAAGSAAPTLLVTAAQWLALGLLGGVSIVGGATFLTSSAPPAASVAPTRSTPGAPPSARRVAPEPMSSAVAAVSAEPALPSDVGAASSANAALPGHAVPAPPALSEATSGRLAREIALIDEARRALLAGQARHSLAVLDAYAALETTGTLNREARVLRIDALLAVGQRALALPLATSYLRDYPRDPQTQKLRALLDNPLGPAR